MAPLTTPAVLLRAHAFGETSRILRFYTREAGQLSVMAKGVRTKSGKGAATLHTFATGELVAYVKAHRDLHTMKDFSCTRIRGRLGEDLLRFAGASLVAEIVGAATDQAAHPEVFGALESSLDDMEVVPPERVPAACLAGAWRVVAALGFAPELEACTACGAKLGGDEVGRFDLAAGGILCAACGTGAPAPRVGPGARGQLRSFLEGDASRPVAHARRHLGLLSDFLSFHVAQAPLKSLRFLGDLLPPDPEA